MKLINRAESFIDEAMALVLSKTIDKTMSIASPIRKIASIENQSSYAVATGKRKYDEGVQKDNQVFFYDVCPMVEPRFYFEIKKGDLELMRDSIDDYDLSSLEQAAFKMAIFEENMVFYGLDKVGIKGLLNSPSIKTIEVSADPKAIMDGILNAAITMRHSLVEGPYKIIVGRDFLAHTSQLVGGNTLASIIEDELGETIEVSANLEGALIVPSLASDLHLNINEEKIIGVDIVLEDSVRFFLSEIINSTLTKEDIVVRLKIKK